MRRYFQLLFPVLVLGFLFASAARAEELIPVEPGQSELARQRKAWFFEQRARPQGFIPADAHLKAHKERDRKERERSQRGAVSGGVIPSGAWRFIGPQPTYTLNTTPVESGRVSALAVDPRNPDVVYLGATLGGVWKTKDGGQNWTPLTDDQPSLSVGSIVLDPANPEIVYVGTGDLSSFYGAGILKSVDAGSTWTNIPGPFVGPFGSNNFFGASARIVSLAIHPQNSQILLAGVWRWPFDQAGVFASTDSGATWTQVLAGPGSDVVFDPADGNIAYAALGNYYGYPASGVYKSTDAGQTWTLDDGTGSDSLPSQTDLGLIRLAIAPSEPSRLYAFVFEQLSSVPLGLFETLDSGAHWTARPPVPQTCCNPLIVQPTNPDVLYGGGTFAGSVFRSLDGGGTWSNVSENPDGTRLHADTHSFAFTLDGTKLYTGNDGGASSTMSVETTPVSWTDLNATLAIATFYPGLSIHPSNINLAFNGTQDGGVQKYTGALPWFEVTCGDGGWTAIDFTTPSTVYATCDTFPVIDIHKSISNGDVGTWFDAETGIDLSDRASFIPPLVMDPSNSQTLYFGSFRVYQTTDGANFWTAISPDLAGGSFDTITTLAVAASGPKTVYAGTGNSRVWVTSNADQGSAATWTERRAGLPPRSVTQIAVDPVDPQVAYVSFSGFSGFDGDTQGHIFRTANGGLTWTDISGSPSNALPNIPVDDVVVDPDFPGTLYVATDVGVFGSSDGGANWSPLGTGLPHVLVLGLKLHRPTRTLRAASYGRSAWDLALAPAPSSTVVIDIKPGSSSNKINPKSNGRIPVAILTTASFDARTVDPGTVRFGKTGTEARAVQSTLEDVNSDGKPDMILHFRTQETGIDCGDNSASLTGKTVSGQTIQGSDSIQTPSSGQNNCANREEDHK